MRREVALAGLALVLFVFAAPAAAQAAPERPPAEVARWIAASAGFGMALAAAFGALSQSRAIAAACEGLARNPGAADAIRFALILGLVLIESLVLFTFAMIYIGVRSSTWW